MTRYLVKRTLWALFVLATVVTAVFFLVHVAGDPATVALGPRATADAIADFKRQKGLDQPTGAQFGSYLGVSPCVRLDSPDYHDGEGYCGLLQGSLGTSYTHREDVAAVIGHRMPRTLLLGVMAMVFELIFGIGAGILAALRRNTWTDTGIMVITFAGISVPTFVTGPIALFVVAFLLGWFPMGGYGVGFWDHVYHGLLPSMIRVASRPVLLQVDPSFDLFRRLDPREIPPSIGQIFGEPRLLAVVAAQASPEERAAWKTLLESWRSDAHSVEIVTDAELAASAELPADRAVWLLGRGNRLAPRYFGGGAVAGLTVDDAGVGFDGQRLPFAGHTTVAVVRHPLSAERAIGWITVDPALLAALPGLGRKLPHYGKYSYLGFEGSEPTNMLKGQWAAADSPLRIDLRVLRPAPERVEPLPALVLPPRPALADLPAN